MPFRRYSGAAGGGETGPSGQGDVRHDMAGDCRRSAAGGLPGSPGGDKRGRDTKVSLPLLTPQPFLGTRLPSVARLKARGPQGRLVLQGHTIDGSGAFRRTRRTLCTVWPRTDMRGKSRKLTSGRPCVPKAARRTEPSSRNPRFAAHLRCVSAKEGKGSQEGTGNHTWCPVPFCPSPWARRFPPVNTGTPRRRTAAIVHALRGRKVASTGCAAVSAEGLPSADGIKERADARWGTICKMFTFEPLTQNEKTAYII